MPEDGRKDWWSSCVSLISASHGRINSESDRLCWKVYNDRSHSNTNQAGAGRLLSFCGWHRIVCRLLRNRRPVCISPELKCYRAPRIPTQW